MGNKYWFSCKVKWKKPDVDGVESTVTEQYLLEGYTYTDVEVGINKIMSELGGGTFQLVSITKTNIVEVHLHEDDELFFKAKLSMVAFDDETGKERQSSFFMIVTGTNIKVAYGRVFDIMRNSGTGYVIPSMAHQKIEDVYSIEDLTPEESKPVG